MGKHLLVRACICVHLLTLTRCTLYNATVLLKIQHASCVAEKAVMASIAPILQELLV